MVTKSNKGQGSRGTKSSSGKAQPGKQSNASTSKEHLQGKLSSEKDIAASQPHRGFYHDITPGRNVHMTESEIEQRKLHGPYSTDDDEDDDEDIEPGRRGSH